MSSKDVSALILDKFFNSKEEKIIYLSLSPKFQEGLEMVLKDQFNVTRFYDMKKGNLAFEPYSPFLSMKDENGSLRGMDTEEICYSLFCYVLDNVQYKEDPGNNQFVKTPARLIRDGVGDCKSMCIFICSCVKCLGIPCKMRFVSFDEREIYSHVYAVAIADGREIIVDPVERLNSEPVFDWARAYTYKKDLLC